MTSYTRTELPNGDVREVMSNPGATPRVYINGILQSSEHKSSWEPWFAWRPVRIRTGERIWLKRIYRRINRYTTYANLVSGSSGTEYEYGTIFDLIRGD